MKGNENPLFRKDGRYETQSLNPCFEEAPDGRYCCLPKRDNSRKTSLLAASCEKGVKKAALIKKAAE